MSRSHLWLTALFIATLSLGTDEFVIAGVLNDVATDLDVSYGAAGQLVTAFALAFGLGAPVLAVLLGHLPRRLVLTVGLAIFVVANVACALAPGLGTLLVCRLFAGLSAAAVSATAFAVAAEGAPEGRQGTYLSVVTAGLTVALFTGVPVGTWISDVWGWRSTFIFIAAVAATATVAAAATMPPLPGQCGSTIGNRLAPLRRPAVARMVAAIFLCGTGGLMFYSYLGPIIVDAFGSDRALPALLLVVGICGVVAALLGGFLTDKVGPRPARLAVVAGHAGALAIAAALIATGAPLWLFGIAVASWSVFAWALNPPMQASTIAASPEAAMTAVSLNISGLYLGTAAAGAIGGAILDQLGAPAIPVVGTVALLLALIVAAPRIRPAVDETQGQKLSVS